MTLFDISSKEKKQKLCSVHDGIQSFKDQWLYRLLMMGVVKAAVQLDSTAKRQTHFIVDY